MEAQNALKSPGRWLVDVDPGLYETLRTKPADDTAPQILTDWGNITLIFKELGFCTYDSVPLHH